MTVDETTVSENSDVSRNGIFVDALSKTYRGGKVRALDGLTLEVAPGQAFGIIGPNGAGKTTLFGCLLGFLRPDSGKITIDGMAPDDIPVRQIVGYLPERLEFDRWMTAIEFLSFHHSLAGRPEATRMQEIEKLLTLVQLDSTAWKMKIGKYSRGMLQRIGLAHSLIGEPKYLLLDEPASGVDPGGVLLFRRILRDLKNSGVTIILNSHQLDQVEKICDKAAFVNKGRIQSIETWAQEEQTERAIIIRWNAAANDDEREAWKNLITNQEIAKVVETGGDFARFTTGGVEEISQLVKMLVRNDIPLIHVSSEEVALERLFIEATAGDESSKAFDTGSDHNDAEANSATESTDLKTEGSAPEVESSEKEKGETEA